MTTEYDGENKAIAQVVMYKRRPIARRGQYSATLIGYLPNGEEVRATTMNAEIIPGDQPQNHFSRRGSSQEHLRSAAADKVIQDLNIFRLFVYRPEV